MDIHRFPWASYSFNIFPKFPHLKKKGTTYTKIPRIFEYFTSFFYALFIHKAVQLISFLKHVLNWSFSSNTLIILTWAIISWLV